MKNEEILKEMGWTIICESPYEIEHNDGSLAKGSSTQLVVDGIIHKYNEIKEKERLLIEENNRNYAIKDLDIKLINGSEIIDFLNGLTKKHKGISNISIELGSFIFEHQRIGFDKYRLFFTGSYHNYGMEQQAFGNEIIISKKGVSLELVEPFELDDTEEVLKEVLTNWIKTHKFSEKQEEDFYEILKKARNKLKKIDFRNKIALENVIKNLVKAKTYVR